MGHAQHERNRRYAGLAMVRSLSPSNEKTKDLKEGKDGQAKEQD